MNSLPQERKDFGLITVILVAVIVAVGGLIFAASHAPTSVADGDESAREALPPISGEFLPESRAAAPVEGGDGYPLGADSSGAAAPVEGGDGYPLGADSSGAGAPAIEATDENTNQERERGGNGDESN